MIDMKRELTDRTNLFASSSAWGWRSDGSLWIDGEKMKQDKTGSGLEPFGRGDKIQLVLDTDAGTLRWVRWKSHWSECMPKCFTLTIYIPICFL